MDVRSVLIAPVSPTRPARRFKLGNAVPQRSDGLGGWQEVPRERRKSLTEFTGPAVDKVDVTVRLEGFPSTPVGPDLSWLTDLGRPVNGQPPTFKMTGPIPLSGGVFVLSAMDFGEQQRRMPDGLLVRQELTLHCWRFNSADTNILTSPAKKANAGSGTSRVRAYTVRRGDTLPLLAAKFYGDGTKWHRIADANHLRDPNYLAPGQVLKIP